MATGCPLEQNAIILKTFCVYASLHYEIYLNFQWMLTFGVHRLRSMFLRSIL